MWGIFSGTALRGSPGGSPGTFLRGSPRGSPKGSPGGSPKGSRGILEVSGVFRGYPGLSRPWYWRDLWPVCVGSGRVESGPGGSSSGRGLVKSWRAVPWGGPGGSPWVRWGTPRGIPEGISQWIPKGIPKGSRGVPGGIWGIQRNLGAYGPRYSQGLVASGRGPWGPGSARGLVGAWLGFCSSSAGLVPPRWG